MRKPYSYTKDDVVEISSHGGAILLNKILEILITKGARLAFPGEFTYRALVKGRIDLLQAESILGIVEAKTEDALSLASDQLKGKLSSKIEQLKRGLQ
jgi:tRNA modification GTPase